MTKMNPYADNNAYRMNVTKKEIAKRLKLDQDPFDKVSVLLSQRRACKTRYSNAVEACAKITQSTEYIDRPAIGADSDRRDMVFHAMQVKEYDNALVKLYHSLDGDQRESMHFVLDCVGVL